MFTTCHEHVNTIAYGEVNSMSSSFDGVTGTRRNIFRIYNVVDVTRSQSLKTGSLSRSSSENNAIEFNFVSSLMQVVHTRYQMQHI